MENRKVIALNTFAQVAGKIVTSASTLLITIILARTLGVSGYGDFTKVTTSALITIRTVLSLVLMTLCILVLFLLPGSVTNGYPGFVKLGIWLFTPTILLQSYITTTNAFFQKNLRYDLASWALLTGSLFSLGATVVYSLSAHAPSIFPYLIFLLFGTLVTAITAILFARPFFTSFSFFSKNVALIKSIFTAALPLGITLLFNVVYFRIDSVVLAISRTTAEVGIYGLAYKFFEFFLVVPTFFMNSVFPLMMSSIKTNNEKRFSALAKKSGLFLFFLSIFLVAAGWVLSPFLPIVMGEFADSILPFRILLLSLPVFFLTSVTMWVMVARNLRGPLLGIYSSSMVVNILANVLLIPRFGYISAAWITLFSEIFILLLSFLAIRLSPMAQKS
jgi:O-antigen/teichoic acid export membrane protein